MSLDRENFRGVHAINLLRNNRDYTLDGLIKLAHDPFLPAFEALIPGLIGAFDNSNKDPQIKEAIDTLRGWNFTTSKASVAMTLAHYYGTEYMRSGNYKQGMSAMERINYWGSESDEEERLLIFRESLAKLKTDFGSWKIPWGEVNRYQRINGDIRQAFDDSMPSIPIGFASRDLGCFGCLWCKIFKQYQKDLRDQRK